MSLDFTNFQTTAIPNYRKIKGGSSILSSITSENQELEIIVRVNEDNYVPGGVNLRNRLSPCLFTGTTYSAELHNLDNDPRVASVSLSQRLRTIG
ncbi:MAG: hypothetical protein QNJ37_00885 [Crocosphaera sp.]|nr:hypothetical protein [Crocosphaera sp.]